VNAFDLFGFTVLGKNIPGVLYLIYFLINKKYYLKEYKKYFNPYIKRAGSNSTS
jgi:hypothetical protein